MKRYLITSEETCPTCEGEKRVKTKTDPNGLLSKDGLKEIFVICDHCKGKGVIRKEVELSEAINEMNIGKPEFNFAAFQKFSDNIPKTYAELMKPVPPPEPVKRNRYVDISDEEIEKAKKSWFYRVFMGIPKHLLD